VRFALWVALLMACGGGGAARRGAETLADTAADTALAAADAAPHRTYPRSRRGALIARAAGPRPARGEWQPAAGVCGDPPTFQLVARGDSFDLILLLRFPSGGPPTGAYAVAPPGDTTAAPGTARLGVQGVVYAESAYQGELGVVELSRLDRLASGRFDVVFRELTSQDTVRYLGVFDRIRVDSLPAADCQPAPRGVPPGVR